MIEPRPEKREQLDLHQLLHGHTSSAATACAVQHHADATTSMRRHYLYLVFA